MEGGAWPYLAEEPPDYHRGGLSHYNPQQAYQGPLSPNYIPVPQHQDSFPPYQSPLPPYSNYGHNQEVVFHNAASPNHSYGPQYPDDIPMSDLPYQYKESEWEEEEEEEDSVPPNSLEAALQEVNIHLPRLAVAAPPSVHPPKGGGRCRLPNLGNSCYMNAVLQCLYHTPSFPACLALVCEELEDRQKQGSTVARSLTFLMTKMDDVKLMKRGMMAYFKGVCGMRDEAFAGMEPQEAHNLLAGLLQWLHHDLAHLDEVDCACTKHSLTIRPTTATTTSAAAAASASSSNTAKHHSSPQGNSTHHHHHYQQQQSGIYQHHPPVNNNYYPNYSVYTGSGHNYSNQHQQSSYDYNYQQQPSLGDHHHYQNNYNKHQEQWSVNQNSNLPPKSDAPDTRREGRVCQKCGVTYQRRSLISDMFEGIHQSDIICPTVGIILLTTYERFTSLSVPLSAPSEVTLEEALQRYYGVNMLMWDCEYCSKSHLCHQQIRVLCAPRILVIHLSRHPKKHSPRKQSISFPTDQLTLEDHMVPGKKDRSHRCSYSLYAVCNHRGTMLQGHYTAVCKANKFQTQQGNWFFFDDEEVSRTTHFKNTREAHILFYRNTAVEMT